MKSDSCPITLASVSLAAAEQARQVQRQVTLDQHAQHAKRMATQGEGVLVAGGQLADAEHVGQGLQLVRQCDAQADIAARQLVAGEARLVVVLDRIGNVGRIAVVQCVVAAHDALQLGELADHVGQEVSLGQFSSGSGRPRIARGCSAELVSRWPVAKF
jgi:hypothetical protein